MINKPCISPDDDGRMPIPQDGKGHWNPPDGEGYITDMEELLDSRLDSKLRSFIEVVMFNQEEIRQGQKEQNKFLKKTMTHDTMIKTIILVQVLMVFAIGLQWVF